MVIEDSPFEVQVTQSGTRPALRVAIAGKLANNRIKKVIRHTLAGVLGNDVNLDDFYRMAARDPQLKCLARRFRGMKPPRFFSVFEGLINGIACQQLSLSLGIHLLNRLAQNFGASMVSGRSLNYGFPRPSDLAHRTPDELRKLGFNFQKARSIIETSKAIAEGRLDLEKFLSLSDEEALQRLLELRGVGRWTAEYTLLRGMGRWDIFPVDDVGARNGLARWLRLRKPLDAKRVQDILAPWKPFGGLIYFYILMSGLDEAGYLARRPGDSAGITH